MKILILLISVIILASLQTEAKAAALTAEDTEEFLAPIAANAVVPAETWSYKFELIRADDTLVIAEKNTTVLLKPASTMKLFTSWWAFKKEYRDDVYLAKMLKESVNDMADETQQEMGGVLGMEDYLREQGLDLNPTNFIGADGSGLSYDNKTNCQLQIDLLKKMRADATYERYKVLLAQPGKKQVGTLKDRLLSLAGKVFAKTGTLNSTASLSGFLETQRGTMVFCVMSDYLKLRRNAKKENITVSNARNKIDAMVKTNFALVK